MNELNQLRTEFSKTFELPDERFNLKVYQHPIHYKTDRGDLEDIDTTVENGIVTKTCYLGSALTDCVGYSVVSKKDGSRIDVKLKDADGKILSYKQPRYENNKVIWEDVDTDLDIILEFRPRWIRLWKKLKSDKAATNFKFTAIVDKGDGKETKLRKGIVGYDSENTPAKLIHNKTLKREFKLENGKDAIEYEIENIFEKKVIVRDKETRKKSLSDRVVYPVMIDVDVNVGIAVSADDGTDKKVYTTGTAACTTVLTNTGSTISLISFDGGSYRYHKQPFMRFDGITIPQTSTISSASLKVYHKNAPLSSAKVYAFDENDPNAPTAAGDLINKTAGLASNIVTTNIPQQAAFTLKNISVATIVQELVTSYDYSNQAMVFFFRPPNDYSSYLVHFYAYDQGTTQDAQLDIVYTAGAGWPHDIGGVANANIGKIGGVAIADVAKVGGVE